MAAAEALRRLHPPLVLRSGRAAAEPRPLEVAVQPRRFASAVAARASPSRVVVRPPSHPQVAEAEACPRNRPLEAEAARPWAPRIHLAPACRPGSEAGAEARVAVVELAVDTHLRIAAARHRSFVDLDTHPRAAAALRFRRRLVASRCTVCKTVSRRSLSIHTVHTSNHPVARCSSHVAVRRRPGVVSAERPRRRRLGEGRPCSRRFHSKTRSIPHSFPASPRQRPRYFRRAGNLALDARRYRKSYTSRAPRARDSPRRRLFRTRGSSLARALAHRRICTPRTSQRKYR